MLMNGGKDDTVQYLPHRSQLNLAQQVSKILADDNKR